MQYGFVINHDTCIGCHACTTACKQENNVPVSHFRTNVKYVEVGKYPSIKRHFLVQRCNHCTDAPCVTICPVNALSKRKDGIVDIDRDACIGCRACMQACPYDALYLNDDLGAVEKCHFCAHRIDQGLSPACVNVCPVGAIVPGDLDDPNSPASRLLAQKESKARRVEQGTGPNVRYIGAHDLALEPGMVERPPTYMWAERPPRKQDPWPKSLPLAKDARTVLDAGHKVEWGWQVALYLVTKGLAAGAAVIAPFLQFLVKRDVWVWPEIVSLFFTFATVLLLIEDLKKPLHFYKLFTRPNWKSWLVKGGIILTAFGGVSAVIVGVDFIAPAVGSPDIPKSFISALRWINLPLGLAAAGYTAFLFAQCKGRDLWEHRLLLPVLLIQAALCGGLVASAMPGRPGQFDQRFELVAWIAASLLGFSMLHRQITHGRQATNNAIQAAAFAKEMKWAGVRAETRAMVFLHGGAFFCALSCFGFPGGGFWAYLGAPICLLGMFLLESVYVRAAQLPPLS